MEAAARDLAPPDTADAGGEAVAATVTDIATRASWALPRPISELA
ncbi:MAG: hypothetical protein ABIO37_16865 [Caulobacteraceae bacterium]